MPTYTAPGVYVEEVPSSQKVLSAAPTAVAAFVGFHRDARRRTTRTTRTALAPRLVTSWTQFESLYGGFAAGLHAAAVGLRLLRQRRRDRLHLPDSEHRPVGRARSARPAGRRPRPRFAAAGRAASTPTPTSPIAISTDDVEDGTETPTTRGAGLVHAHRARGRRAGREVPEPRPSAATRGRQDRRQQGLHQGQGRARPRQGRGPRRPARAAQARAVPLAKAAPRTDAGHRPQVRRLGDGPHGHQRSGHRRGRHDGRRAGPDHRRDEGRRHHRPRPVEGRADRADLALRAERQPDGHPRRAARDDAAADQGVALRDGDVRLAPSPRCTTRGSRSRTRSAINGDAEMFIPPSGHIAGVWARTDETRGVWKAPANDTIRGVLDIERAITKDEQSLLNPIGINCIRPFGTRGIRDLGRAHARLGHRLALHQRAPAVQHGRDDDPGRHAVGGVRAERRDAVGRREAHAHRLPARPVARGCTVRRHAPTRRSTSSATPRPTRRSRSTRASSSSRSASRR